MTTDRPPTSSADVLMERIERLEKWVRENYLDHNAPGFRQRLAQFVDSEIRLAEHAAAEQEARKWQAGKRGLDWPGFNEEGLRVSFEYIRGHSSPSGARSTFDNVIRQARDQARREEREPTDD